MRISQESRSAFETDLPRSATNAARCRRETPRVARTSPGGQSSRAASVSAEPPTLPGKTSSFHASFSKRTVLSGRGASTERKLGCGRHQRGENAFPARANHRGKAPARPWVQRPRGCSGPRTGNQGRRGAGDPRGPPRTHLGGAARLRAGEDRGVATENRSKAAAKTLKTAGPEQRKQTKSMPAQAPHQRAPRQPPPRQQPRRALRPGGPRGVPEGRLTCPRRRRPRGPARGAQGPPHAPGCRPPLRTRVLPSVPRPRDPANEPPLPGTPLLPAPTGRLARVRTDSSAARGTLHVAARPSSPPLCGERRQGEAGLPRSAGGRDTGPMSRLEGRRPRCACQPSVAPAPDAHRKARTPGRPAA